MPMTIRFATPEDAGAFAEWASKNPQISPKDMLAAMKANNPTSTVLVVEQDGVARLFMPVYLSLTIAFLGFNPENTREQNLEALDTMHPFVKEFARFWAVHEINTLTKSGIPVAEWARGHGFDPEDRELFTLRVEPMVTGETRVQ